MVSFAQDTIESISNLSSTGFIIFFNLFFLRQNEEIEKYIIKIDKKNELYLII